MSSVKEAQRKLVIATAIAMAFMVAEIIGGTMAGSLAILTDAAHLLSDVLGFGVSLAALQLTKLRPTAVMSFGFKRAEVLGALLSVVLIWVLTFFLLLEASSRAHDIIDPTREYKPVKGDIMLLVATLGLICNLVILFVLGGHGHSHAGGGGGGHSHSHTENEEDHHHSDDEDEEDGHGHGHSHSQLYHSHSPSKPQTTTITSTTSETRPLLQNNKNNANVNYTSPTSSNTVLRGRHASFESAGRRNTSRSHSVDLNGLSITYGASTDSAEEEEVEQREKQLHPRVTRNASHNVKRKSSAVNVNVSAAYLHALSDFVQSIGVIIAGLVIWWFPDSRIAQLADPLATLLFSALVLYSTNELIKSSVHVLMEGVPDGLDLVEVCTALENIDNVSAVHDLHIWGLSTDEAYVSVHVVATQDEFQSYVLRDATFVLKQRFGISHITIQVETEAAVTEVCAPPHFTVS